MLNNNYIQIQQPTSDLQTMNGAQKILFSWLVLKIIDSWCLHNILVVVIVTIYDIFSTFLDGWRIEEYRMYNTIYINEDSSHET